MVVDTLEKENKEKVSADEKQSGELQQAQEKPKTQGKADHKRTWAEKWLEKQRSRMKKKHQEDPETKATKQRKWYFVRKFPLLLRVFVVLVLLALSLMFGLMVGYGVLGDGTPTDVLHKDTWQHILDIINKE
jgi:cation transport ATPase